MKWQTVDVLGGGPGGLFAARLLRRANPDSQVVVHEQHDPANTFGFGVGIASGTQRNIALADPEVHDAVLAASHAGTGMTMRLTHGTASVPADGVVGIGRATLLQELSRLAKDAGVQIRYGRRRALSETNADLVVAADGVSSTARHDLQDEIGATVEHGRGLYLWCGAEFALDSAIFELVETAYGPFTVHAYPYADDKSTFLVETDETTWRHAGFDTTTARTPPQESDQQALRYLQHVFSETLQGRPLIGNRTRWERFRTVSCHRSYHDNVALVGDAAHTAHYSIGSGTKLAMEDAIALVEAIVHNDTLTSALEAYDHARRPKVASLQLAARRSQTWWESFPERLALPVETLLVSYMTRTGHVDLARLHTMAPDVLQDALDSYAHEASTPPHGPDLVPWVLNRAFSKGRVQTARRVVDHEQLAAHSITNVEFDLDSAWTAEADLLLTELAGHDLGLEVLWLTRSDATSPMFALIDFAERAKNAYPRAVVLVEGDADSLVVLAAALVSGRLDLIAVHGDDSQTPEAGQTTIAPNQVDSANG